MAQLLHLVFLSATDVVIFYKEVQFTVLILIAWHFPPTSGLCVGGWYLYVSVCTCMSCVCVCVCHLCVCV